MLGGVQAVGDGMMTRMMARKRATEGLKSKPVKQYGADYVALQKGIQKNGKCHKRIDAQKKAKVSMLVVQGNACAEVSMLVLTTNSFTTLTTKRGDCKCVDA